MADYTEGELSSTEDIAAARQQFLSNPPGEVVEPTPEPTVDEGAAIDEQLAQAPAEGGEGATAPAPAPAPAGTPDPFAAYGGEEAVRVAHQVQEALRTREGLNVLVANGLTALGYQPQAIKAALDAYAAGETPGEQTAPAATDPLAGLDDDEPLTAAQARQLFAQQQAAIQEQARQAALAAAQQQVAPLQETIQEQQARTVKQNADAAIISVLGPVPSPDAPNYATYVAQAQELVQRGSAYYDPTQWADPAHVHQAILRAHAEQEAANEARYQAYLQRKKEDRGSQPVNTGGGAAGAEPLPEPKSMAEARKMAKAAGFFD